MARGIYRLSTARVRNAKPGKRPDGTPRVQLYADGGGLYLQVTPGSGSNSKSWIYRYTSSSGKERFMGLGSLDAVSLADAREKAAECRRLRERGTDPIDARGAQRASAAIERAKAMTFDQCAEQYIAAHRAGWRSHRHLYQWKNTLAEVQSSGSLRRPEAFTQEAHG
jgi:Arm DNA-binding domain